MAAVAGVVDKSKTVLFFCFLTAFCEGIDLQAAGVAAVGISAEFLPTAVQKSWFFSASTIGLTLGAVFGGRAADRVGRKLILVWSIAVFGLFSLLTPLAWDMHSLTAARLLTGLGLGGALPNMIALVAESSAPNRHKANVALVYSGTPLGGALASLVSMYSGTEDWRVVFVLGGVLPLLIAVLMARLVDESTEFRAYKNSLAQSGAALPSAGRWLAVLEQGRALRSVLLWVSFFLGLLTLYLLLNWLPTLLIGNGFSKDQASAAQIALNIGGFVSALFVGRCMETRWRQPSVIVTFVALPIMILVLGRITTASSFAYMLAVTTLLGCAIVSAQAVLYAFAPSFYPVSIRGVGVGTAVAVGRIGSIVGPLAVPLLVSGAINAQVLLKLLPIVVVCGVSAITLSTLISKPAQA